MHLNRVIYDNKHEYVEILQQVDKSDYRCVFIKGGCGVELVISVWMCPVQSTINSDYTS